MLTSQKEYEPRNDLLTIVLHDIQSPLRFISTVTQDLADNCTIMDKQTLLNHSKILNNSIIALQHYCNKINVLKNSRQEFTDINKQVIINEIFTEINGIYAPIIAAKKIKFNTIETNVYCFTIKEILFIIIINLIDNAYKYTDAGSITLQATKKNNKILVLITDTGKGMQKKLIDDILSENPKLILSSLGYYIIKDLLKKINGTISINSKINVGTQVTISLLNP